MREIRWPALGVVIAGGHALAAGFAWRLLPHGFATSHPRFWTNEVTPMALVAIAVACVIAVSRTAPRIASASLTFFAAFDAGMAAGWALAFPLTGKQPGLISAVIAAGVSLCAFGMLRRREHARVPVALAIALGILGGASVPFAQRGADPGTHPAAPIHDLGHGDGHEPTPLPAWIELAPRAATVRLVNRGVEIDLEPALAFYSLSPDRGWTVFAAAKARAGTPHTLSSTSADAVFYAGDEPAMLSIAATDTRLAIDAQTTVPREVYSHLNSFCAIQIRGHRHLSIAFSPMPDQRIEVTYSEYPTGRPSRFAYVDAASVLHVVEATSGEKGPFAALAHGTLAGPLGLTLFDGDQPIAELAFADFAAQASTQASPTAGWGVPENAIEFSLDGDRSDAPASIYMTLAGTSVGRGWDSVGHAPGTYRNRLTVTKR